MSVLGDRKCRLSPQRAVERWHESGIPKARPRTLLLTVAEAQPAKFPGLKCDYSKSLEAAPAPSPGAQLWEEALGSVA